MYCIFLHCSVPVAVNIGACHSEFFGHEPLIAWVHRKVCSLKALLTMKRHAVETPMAHRKESELLFGAARAPPHKIRNL